MEAVRQLFPGTKTLIKLLLQHCGNGNGIFIELPELLITFVTKRIVLSLIHQSVHLMVLSDQLHDGIDRTLLYRTRCTKEGFYQTHSAQGRPHFDRIHGREKWNYRFRGIGIRIDEVCRAGTDGIPSILPKQVFLKFRLYLQMCNAASLNLSFNIWVTFTVKREVADVTKKIGVLAAVAAISAYNRECMAEKWRGFCLMEMYAISLYAVFAPRVIKKENIRPLQSFTVG